MTRARMGVDVDAVDRELSDLKRQLAEAQARAEALAEALRDVIKGTDGARGKVLEMVHKQILVEDFAFWMRGWLEFGTSNIARARAALNSKDGE